MRRLWSLTAWVGVRTGLEAISPWGAARLTHMNARIDHLIDEALLLAPDERSAVVLALLDSLDGEDEATVTELWANEIRQRKNQLRSGAAKAVPLAEARTRLNAL